MDAEVGSDEGEQGADGQRGPVDTCVALNQIQCHQTAGQDDGRDGKQEGET